MPNLTAREFQKKGLFCQIFFLIFYPHKTHSHKIKVSSLATYVQPLSKIFNFIFKKTFGILRGIFRGDFFEKVRILPHLFNL